jgi:hypothetical protein
MPVESHNQAHQKWHITAVYGGPGRSRTVVLATYLTVVKRICDLLLIKRLMFKVNESF